MIKTVKATSFRNNEYLQFIEDVVSRCRKAGIDNARIDKLVSILHKGTVELGSVYNKENKSEVTELLIKSDGLRDGDLVGIRTTCEGLSYSRSAVIAEAAKCIVDSIDRYGKSIARMNYKAETSTIDAIILDWETEEKLKKAIDILSLNEWVKDLKKENANFSQLYQRRIDDKLSTSGKTFAELRQSTFVDYGALCETIYAYSIIDKSDEYKSLIDAINLIIEDYNGLVERRQTMKSVEEEA